MTRRARILKGTSANLRRLAAVLQQGGLVAVPTETVYGLAANALDARACRGIFRAKRRPAADPLIVHVHSLAQLYEIARPNNAALQLAAAFWPGPLTLVLPKRSHVPDVVTAGRDTVAVRMPAHPLLRKLLQKTGIPLAAPSANPFGYISPTTAAHVRDGLGTRIPFILDGGACAIGLESTIVDARRPALRILRPGAITAAQLEAVAGRRVSRSKPRTAAGSGEGLVAPGLLSKHYSPRTPLVAHKRLKLAAAAKAPREAWVFLAKPRGAVPANVHFLDRSGRLETVAHELFALLRVLDAKRYRRIHIELAAGGGLADAINDRIRRAAAKR